MKVSNKIVFPFLFIILMFSSCKEHYPQGKRLYEFYCSSCHMSDGTGLGALIPPIKNSDYLKHHFNDLPCIIRYGMFDTINVNGVNYSDIMIGIPNLNEIQISNIMNYIADVFIELPEGQKYNVQEIDSILNMCLED